MEVVFSPAALSDLVYIRAYISIFNPTAAERMAEKLIEVSRSLARFPERGRPGSVPGTREMTIIHPYVLVYETTAERVLVLRIWHGAQHRP